MVETPARPKSYRSYVCAIAQQVVLGMFTGFICFGLVVGFSYLYARLTHGEISMTPLCHAYAAFDLRALIVLCCFALLATAASVPFAQSGRLWHHRRHDAVKNLVSAVGFIVGGVIALLFVLKLTLTLSGQEHSMRWLDLPLPVTILLMALVAIAFLGLAPLIADKSFTDKPAAMLAMALVLISLSLGFFTGTMNIEYPNLCVL